LFALAAWPIFLFNLAWPVKFMKSRTVADKSRVFCAGVILEWCKVVQGGSGWLGVAGRSSCSHERNQNQNESAQPKVSAFSLAALFLAFLCTNW